MILLLCIFFNIVNMIFSQHLLVQALPQLEIQLKRFESDSKNIRLTIKDTLGQLTSQSLTELRSINKPESHIEDIIVAVIMLCEFFEATC